VAAGAQGAGRLKLPPLGRPLILASASPRRADLLASLGWSFEIAPADVDETPLPGEKPRDASLRLAIAKAKAAAAGRAHGTILAGDTVIDLNGRVLGKPAGEADARAMLTALAGQRHRVFTAVAVLVAADGKVRSGVSESTVVFLRLPPAELDRYIASGEWQGKAGAYALQGQAARFAHLVSGREDTVVGLPLDLVERLLEEVHPSREKT